MDYIVRSNCGAELNEYVRMHKAQVKEAEKIVFAPTSVELEADIARSLVESDTLEFLKRRYMDMPFSQGDTAIFNMFGSEIPLVVIEQNPPEPVKVGEDTTVQVDTSRVIIKTHHPPKKRYSEQEIEEIVDCLDIRLAKGEITEQTYRLVKTKWEQRSKE